MRKRLRFLIFAITLIIAFASFSACGIQVEVPNEGNGSGNIERPNDDSKDDESSKDENPPEGNDSEGGGDWTGVHLPN